MNGGRPSLTERQRLAWLRLIRTENVGPATFRDLINRFGSAEAALEALPEMARRGGGRSPSIPPIAAIEREMERANATGARFVAIGEADYPPAMRGMDHPPPLLAVRGEAAVLSLPVISIVGARNASLAGVKIARSLARNLGAEGFAVASGLARGIDAAAHRGSLDTGTIAFLAGGLDRPYPPENAALSDEICERGAIVSEMPFGWEPRAKDFPRRNRLVAGICLALVVVEAARRSGSLISARLAGEMGRLVFAVPGSPLDPRAAGTNGLLKDGASIVTETRDVLEGVMPLLGRPSPPPETLEEPSEDASVPPPGDDERSRVVEALGPVPVSRDDILRHTGLHPAQLSLILLELELAGRLERHSGGAVSMPVPEV